MKKAWKKHNPTPGKTFWELRTSPPPDFHDYQNLEFDMSVTTDFQDPLPKSFDFEHFDEQ